jgi:hypothetical protein
LQRGKNAAVRPARFKCRVARQSRQVKYTGRRSGMASGENSDLLRNAAQRGR